CPKAAAGNFMGIGLLCHPIGHIGDSPRMLGCLASRKAGDGQIKASPEKMDRAAFSPESTAEAIKDIMDTKQCLMESGDLFRVIGGMYLVLVEGYRIFQFRRHRPDFDVDLQLL